MLITLILIILGKFFFFKSQLIQIIFQQAHGPTKPQQTVATVSSPSSTIDVRVTDVRLLTGTVHHGVPPQWTPMATCLLGNTALTPPALV